MCRGMAWHRMMWHDGMAWHGAAWRGMAHIGMPSADKHMYRMARRPCMAWHAVAWHGPAHAGAGSLTVVHPAPCVHAGLDAAPPALAAERHAERARLPHARRE